MTERTEIQQYEKSPEKHGERKFLYNSEYTSGHQGQSNAIRKLLIAVGILVGLGVIVWGGYLLYSKKVNGNTEILEATPVDNNQEVQPQSDTTSSVTQRDSPMAVIPTPPSAPGQYKFVCEVTNTKQRAMSRYAALQPLNPQYKMETADSIHFKIYVFLPASPADTTRQKDSLRAWYWGARDRIIRIER
ncbi:MAG: hypothetical protein H7Y31_07605 [Chitinophagaceae bacterium]|nr:hypothetical protein [Chitinophagaceae bacterium]